MTLYTRLRFEEPPPKQQGRSGKPTKHQAIATKLRKHPGEWALIGTYSSANSAASIAHMISHGKATAYTPKAQYEGTSRHIDSKYCVYARYVGPGGEYA